MWLVLGHAEPVAERVLADGFDSVELFFRRAGELDTVCLQFFVSRLAIRRVEDADAESSFGNEFSKRGCGFGIAHRSFRDFHERDFEIGLTFRANSEPAKSAVHCGVGMNVQAQFVAVERQCDILIEYVYGGMAESLNHRGLRMGNGFGNQNTVVAG